MDTRSHVEVLHLHCEHLRTLIDRVLLELTTLGHMLATDDPSSSGNVAPQLNALEKHSAHIAVEATRLQSFVHSLRPQRTDAAEASEESHQSSSATADMLFIADEK